MIFALALAGGRSDRFGREKAVEPFAGAPMIAWVLQALSNGSVQQAVNAAATSAVAAFAGTQGLRRLADPADAATGPLAGVLAGMRWAAEGGATWLATAPCDTPLIPADIVERLSASRAPGGAVVRTSAGLEPLCALWPVAARGRLEDLEGHPPIRSVLSELGATEVLFEDHDAFANLNTAEEFASAQARVSSEVDCAARRRPGGRSPYMTCSRSSTMTMTTIRPMPPLG